MEWDEKKKKKEINDKNEWERYTHDFCLVLLSGAFAGLWTY